MCWYFGTVAKIVAVLGGPVRVLGEESTNTLNTFFSCL